MREMELTRGLKALVDDDDFAWLSEHKWRAKRLGPNSQFYAARDEPRRKDGYRRLVWMHREIMGLSIGSGRDVDHADHDALNNCRSNLRIATKRQNQQNRAKGFATSSKFKGVSWSSHHKKWQVHIRTPRKRMFLGHFSDEELAARAYDSAAIREFGEFARPNFR